MRSEQWRVILFTELDTYAGSEKFDAGWKAKQYAQQNIGRGWAKVEHWTLNGTEIVKQPEPTRPRTSHGD